MMTLSSIEPEMNGFGRYHAVTRDFFHAKTVYFRQLNVHKCVPFHPGTVQQAIGNYSTLYLAHQDMTPPTFGQDSAALHRSTAL